MPRTSRHPKEENFNFRVSTDLKAAFKAATEMADRPAAQVLRDFMRAYVEQNPSSDPDHEAWFRRQVEAAIDDPRPNIPHNDVVNRTRAAIDRIAAEKARSAG